MHYQTWQISQERGWREWTVEYPNGDWQAVDARIAVTAHRKGLVTYEDLEAKREGGQ